MDVVFHTAALLPFSIQNTSQDMEMVNIEGTRNIVAACKECGIKRLVYTSSSIVTLSKDPKVKYEEVEEFDPLPEAPLDVYVRTKGAAERIVIEASSEEGLRTCALRLGGLIGGRDNLMMSYMMSPTIFRIGRGEFTSPYTTLEAAAKVHLLADQCLSKKPLSAMKNVFNIVSAHSKYKDLTSFFSLENKGRVCELPLFFCKLLAFINECFYVATGWAPLGNNVSTMTLGYSFSFTLSTKHTERELGWVDKRPWREIMKEIIADYNAEVDEL